VRKAPQELTAFLEAYPPHVGKLFLATRRLVLEAAPGCNELVYDAYNAVTAAYSFSERVEEAFCHVATYSGHVNLGFNRGAALPDPEGILRGSGARIRHVRIQGPADLRAPALERLLRDAVAQGRELEPAEREAKAASRIDLPAAGSAGRSARGSAGAAWLQVRSTTRQ
jgi:hypothetical protein